MIPVNLEQIKKQFPIFSNNPDLTYLDNAATTQKPQRVINSLVDFYSKYNSNVHRGLYPLSETATVLYENARKTIAKFINAEPEEIIFSSGTTDGINAIADSLLRSKMVSENPKILLTETEHHSNILPWMQISNVSLSFIQLDKNNELKLDDSKLESDYDVLAINHSSNVTGGINDIKLVVEKARANGKRRYIVLDAAQSIAHLPIDVKELDVDFMVFSGHKMYGPTGIGVIYAKRELLENMDPFKVGGGMIREVTKQAASWGPLPEKFEAGTPPIADAIALAEAALFIQEIGFENIKLHEQELRRYMVNRLKEIEGMRIFHPDLDKEALGVISFYTDKVHPHDLAQFLGDRNVCVRAGHHCTQILHREILNIPASIRASLSIYNSAEDIDKMMDALQEGIHLYQ